MPVPVSVRPLAALLACLLLALGVAACSSTSGPKCTEGDRKDIAALRALAAEREAEVPGIVGLATTGAGRRLSREQLLSDEDLC